MIQARRPTSLSSMSSGSMSAESADIVATIVAAFLGVEFPSRRFHANLFVRLMYLSLLDARIRTANRRGLVAESRRWEARPSSTMTAFCIRGAGDKTALWPAGAPRGGRPQTSRKEMGITSAM